MAICGLTYATARTLVPPAGALAAAALAAGAAFGTGNTSFVLPHTLSAPLGVALALAAIIALARRNAGGGLGWTAVAGVACGLAALARPDAVAVAGAAAAAWLLGRALTRRPLLADLGALAGPALAIPAVVYGALLTQVSFDRLVHDNLLPTGPLSQGAGEVLRLSAPGTLGVVRRAGGARAALRRGRRRPRRRWPALPLGGRAAVALAVLGAAALGFLAAIAIRPELVRHHLESAYAWIPAGALRSARWLVLARAPLRRRPAQPRIRGCPWRSRCARRWP